MTKFLELIVLVLIIRALIPIFTPYFMKTPQPKSVPPSDADLYKGKPDIVDGEFEEVKK